MSKFLVKVPYLEGSDINPDGSLKSYVCNRKPVVLMVQGNFCGYCTKAKPAFQQFSISCNNARAVTIQSDGGESDMSASKNISPINTAKGVPAYLGFDKNGKFVSIHNGDRDVASLTQFANSL